jgi:hypothetical protein
MLAFYGRYDAENPALIDVSRCQSSKAEEEEEGAVPGFRGAAAAP